MNKPSVSIIVPVYNVRSYVEDCIKSVMCQTYDGEMECIVVDDCGTDNSMAIVERLIAKYTGPITFKVLHHTHNRGLSASRNTGMDEVTGDYLFFLDSDDELTNDCIEILAKPLEKEWCDVVVGKCILISMSSYEKEEMTLCYNGNVSAAIEFLRVPNILRNYKIKWGVPAWNKLYRTQFLHNNQLRFKEALIHEDVLWSFQVACLAASLSIVNRTTYKYNQREGSITYPLNKERQINAYGIILKEMSIFVDNNRIGKEDVFRIFSIYFYEIMKYYSFSLKNYVSNYKSMRTLFDVPIMYLFQKNRYKVKKCLYEFHFILPVCIAPYWQYIIYYLLRPLIKRYHG